MNARNYAMAMKMRKPFPLAIALLMGLLCSVSLRAQTPPAQLIWKNGDRLPVVPDIATKQWLTVKSPLFQEPLSIDVRVLDQILFDRDQADDGKPVETFAIQMIDGQTLYGTIKKMDEAQLVVNSTRTGDVVVDRNRVASIVNLDRTEMVVSGGFDLAKWDAKRGEKKYWVVNDRGQLESRRQNIHLYLKSDLPQSCLVEVEVQWKRKLDFSIALGVPANSRKIDQVARLESWDDSIVFSYGDEFEIVVEELDKTEKRVKFLLHWDQKTDAVVIHDERGKVLATANVGKVKNRATPGIYFENKSGDLKVSSLSIRSSGANFDATKPSVQIVGKPALNAALKWFDGDVWTAEDADGELVEVAAENFSGTFLLNPAVDEVESGDVVKFTDGFRLSGNLLGLAEGRAKFRSNVSSEPITLKLDRVAAIQFERQTFGSEEGSYEHRLFNAAGSMQGMLESGSGKEGDVLRWRAVGGKTAVPFLSSNEKGGGARVVLQKRKQKPSSEKEWRDTLYLKNRDMVPCTVARMDENTVFVDSFFEKKAIADSLIKAVHFKGGGDSPTEVSLEDDSTWDVAGGEQAVAFKDNEMKIKKNGTAFHSWLLSRGGFEFELDWPRGNYGILQLKMGAAADAVSNQGCAIMLWGQSVGAGAITARNPVNGMISRGSGPVNVRIELKDERLHVYLDGKKSHQAKVKLSENIGVGMQLRLVDSMRQNISCEISKMKMLKGDPVSMQVDSKRKEFLLTIPRLKVRNLPKQILCAANRDMVRGQLVSMSDEFVMFRSNNVVNRYGRDVLTSMVWIDHQQIRDQLDAEYKSNLKPAEEADAKKTLVAEPVVDAAADFDEQQVQLLLHGGRRISMRLKERTAEHLVGESEALGRCEIPFDQIYEMRFGDFATQASDVAYSNWVAKLAPKPKLESGGATGESGDMAFGSSSPLIGTSPKISVDLLGGETVSLKKYRGKVLVLDFWATWCGPCVKALPKVKAVCESYSADEVVLLAINQAESKSQVEEFLQARKLELTVAMDEGKLSEDFNVEAIPQTVVIDQAGVIRFVKVGASRDLEERLAAAIGELLDKAPAAK
jgi:thiol-disulfide isomerase/thioredoxin